MGRRISTVGMVSDYATRWTFRGSNTGKVYHYVCSVRTAVFLVVVTCGKEYKLTYLNM